MAARVTGERPTGTVPDRFIAEAGEIEFVDIAPTALRRRIAHGNVVPPEQAQQVLRGPFRIEALGAMRELALRLVATRLGEGRMAPAPEPQDVLVAVATTPRAPSLIRRGTRLARRTGGRCTVLTVTGDRDGDATSRLLERARDVAHHLGATFVERRGGNVTRVIQESVRELVVDHLVIGDSPPPPWFEVWRRPMTRHLIDSLPDVDVHVIARPYPAGSGSSRIQPKAAADSQRERRGSFRIYLGYARGCGTTTAMLDEPRRRRSRGTDVAIAAICRPHTRTESAIGDVPLIGENGDVSVPTRLDVDRVLTRNPQVACIDDLADALGADGYRLLDLDRMLDAGITLIATLHLSDLRSTAEALDFPPEAGATALDDAVIGMATDIELVDVPVSVLIERVKRGQVVPRESVDAALEGEFSEARLARLREHAFRIAAWKADQQEVALLRADGDGPQWDERPRVMACVAPRPGMERLIRKAAALAASLDTDFRAVTVITSASQPEALLRHYGALVRQLGGEMVTLTGRSAAQVLAGYARDNLVTEILVTRGQHDTRAGRTLKELIRSVSEVVIHVLAAEQGVDRP